MADLSPFEEDEPWRRAQIGLVVLTVVLVAGTVAYRMLGLTWVDALYQTLITITTVGYGEIPPESGLITPTYRAVTSLLLLGGVSIGLYTLGVFFESVLEGRIAAQFGRVRMKRELDELSNHIIVCGYGQVGQAIAAEILNQGSSLVVIDRSEDIHQRIDVPTVCGDATSDEILEAAGITRAGGLVTALDTDAANLFVTVSAHTMAPTIHIVARANEASSVNKLLAAGANRVVNPHEIGGIRMASFMLQPNVADFVGESMSDSRFEVRLEETPIASDSALDGLTLGDSFLAADCGVTILAIRHSDGSFAHMPEDDEILVAGDVLIALGTSEHHQALKVWMAAQSADGDADRSR